MIAAIDKYMIVMKEIFAFTREKNYRIVITSALTHSEH